MNKKIAFTPGGQNSASAEEEMLTRGGDTIRASLPLWINVLHLLIFIAHCAFPVMPVSKSWIHRIIE